MVEKYQLEWEFFEGRMHFFYLYFLYAQAGKWYKADVK